MLSKIKETFSKLYFHIITISTGTPNKKIKIPLLNVMILQIIFPINNEILAQQKILFTNKLLRRRTSL